MVIRAALLWLVALLGAAVLACGSDTAALEDTRPKGSTAPAIDRPPPATAAAGGMSVPMGTGTFCWSSSTTPGICIDMTGPVTGTGELPVRAGGRVAIKTAFPGSDISEAEVSAIAVSTRLGRPAAAGELVWNFPPVGGVPVISTVDADGLHFDAALAPGRHVVIVFLRVPQGDVSYGVVLDVR